MREIAHRYDAKLAYYLMLPGIVVSLLGALGPAFFRLCLKIIGVWVTLSAAWLMASTCANIHVLGATGLPLNAAQVDLFFNAPFANLAAYSSSYPIFFDTVMTLFVTGLFFGLVWTSAQTSITSMDPLTAAQAKISKIPMVNYIVMNAPMSIYYSDSHAMLGDTAE